MQTNISDSYFHLGQLRSAQTYARKALQIRHLEYMKYGPAAAYQVDSAHGNYKSAFEHHK
jgi:hypothetical protein